MRARRLGGALVAVALQAMVGDGSAMAQPAGMLDDRTSGTTEATVGARWRMFTDNVMGGVSTGSLSVETVDGRPALCLRGQVRLENNGGFVQMALELPALPATPAGVAAWQGIELDVLGNGRRYGVHLRTADLWLPWQAWRASFEAPPRWQTVRLPFERFEPYRVSGRFDLAQLRRIGLVAIGEAGEAALCLGRLALY